MAILYSFRRCPYAMRARLALALANHTDQTPLTLELREVVLKKKPQALLDASPKATVPVLVLDDGQVVDESLDIMLWALEQGDPQHLLEPLKGDRAAMLELIQVNDGEFKQALDKYKYFERYPQQSQAAYYQQAEFFLQDLAAKLEHSPYLFGARASLADWAIWPFIRQFAHVDKAKFAASAPKPVQDWLALFLASEPLAQVMQKYPPWLPDDAPRFFP